MENRSWCRGDVKVYPLIRYLLVLGASLAWGAGEPVSPSEDSSASIQVVRRLILPNAGEWKVLYVLRNVSERGMVIAPEEWSVDISGSSVSNSRVPGHGSPRSVEHVLSSQSEFKSNNQLIGAKNKEVTCEEVASARLVDDVARTAHPESSPPLPIAVAPGADFYLQISLAHNHVISGDYEPLFGERNIRLRMRDLTLDDSVSLDVTSHFAVPLEKVLTYPIDRTDNELFKGALHLEAHDPTHLTSVERMRKSDPLWRRFFDREQIRQPRRNVFFDLSRSNTGSNLRRCDQS